MERYGQRLIIIVLVKYAGLEEKQPSGLSWYDAVRAGQQADVNELKKLFNQQKPMSLSIKLLNHYLKMVVHMNRLMKLK